MRSIAATLFAALALHAIPASAQTVSVEAAQTIGQTTDGPAVAATQLRVFGEALSATRFVVEGAWGARSNETTETDAFGSAYPYENEIQLIEAYGERTFRRRAALLSVHAGRFRTPFGISSGSDHAYSGFLRAPLIRYDDYYALSNNFLENGVSVTAGTPSFSVETTFGSPSDVGEAHRRPGLDRVIRAQGAYRSLILGVSHISTNPFQSPRFAFGKATFTGLDARWMKSGVQLRGEWIAGQPFNGTRTTGGYVDLLVHRPGLGPVTAVARAERVSYVATPPYDLYAHRYVAGAKVRLVDTLTAQVNVARQHGLREAERNSLDVAFTYVFRFDARRSRE